MPYEPSKLTQTGTAEFYADEFVGLHESSAVMTPAEEYYKGKDAVRQAQEVVKRAYGDYIDGGIEEFENYANAGQPSVEKPSTKIEQSHAEIAWVTVASENLAAFRRAELQAV